MKRKNKKMYISHPMQKVAVDILNDLEIILMQSKELDTREKIFDEISKIINVQSKKYCLGNDPFTHMLCTSKEFGENWLEYQKQSAILKYGHCDWLE